jgi:hypothetical protein
MDVKNTKQSLTTLLCQYLGSDQTFKFTSNIVKIGSIPFKIVFPTGKSEFA